MNDVTSLSHAVQKRGQSRNQGIILTQATRIVDMDNDRAFASLGERLESSS
jgi:hypothetical protein